MQSLTVYGRIVVRALLTELGGETPVLAWHRDMLHGGGPALRRTFHLVTATAGISKLHSAAPTAASSAASRSMSVGGLPMPSHPETSTFVERTFGDDAFFVAKHRLGDVLGEIIEIIDSLDFEEWNNLSVSFMKIYDCIILYFAIPH